ncbi:unnamed protein product [Strongylus vulgaris]|uniref:Uncharacterized protein n=1 Tax=Strongylus vulgaris TaxID=40348 RepID=A0A3P7IHM6_STRVU|nr:unnamed protein product [Strongylus vulgaris]
MNSVLVFLLFLISPAFACNMLWPNGTDTNFIWWQCSNGPVQFYNATPQDVNGNYMYPIHLSKPLVVALDLLNPTNIYTEPSLVATANLWSWGTALGGCAWSAIPTFGLL